MPRPYLEEFALLPALPSQAPPNHVYPRMGPASHYIVLLEAKPCAPLPPQLLILSTLKVLTPLHVHLAPPTVGSHFHNCPDSCKIPPNCKGPSHTPHAAFPTRPPDSQKPAHAVTSPAYHLGQVSPSLLRPAHSGPPPFPPSTLLKDKDPPLPRLHPLISLALPGSRPTHSPPWAHLAEARGAGGELAYLHRLLLCRVILIIGVHVVIPV